MSASVLLTGDVESGPRADPSEPAVGAEREMFEHAAELLDVDVLQVAHHGSMTSSRAELLAAEPLDRARELGPEPVRQRDAARAAVLQALEQAGARVLTTFEHDEERTDDDGGAVEDRVGQETGPSGCDNWILEL